MHDYAYDKIVQTLTTNELMGTYYNSRQLRFAYQCNSNMVNKPQFSESDAVTCMIMPWGWQAYLLLCTRYQYPSKYGYSNQNTVLHDILQTYAEQNKPLYPSSNKRTYQTQIQSDGFNISTHAIFGPLQMVNYQCTVYQSI